MLNKWVIVRSDKAGVFFGVLVEKVGEELTLTNVRKLCYWSGANTVEDLAVNGVKNPNSCEFTRTVKHLVLQTYDQIIICEETAIDNLKNVPVWTA